jgi:hypothetical protein
MNTGLAALRLPPLDGEGMRVGWREPVKFEAAPRPRAGSGRMRGHPAIRWHWSIG